MNTLVRIAIMAVLYTAFVFVALMYKSLIKQKISNISHRRVYTRFFLRAFKEAMFFIIGGVGILLVRIPEIHKPDYHVYTYAILQCILAIVNIVAGITGFYLWLLYHRTLMTYPANELLSSIPKEELPKKITRFSLRYWVRKVKNRRN